MNEQQSRWVAVILLLLYIDACQSTITNIVWLSIQRITNTDITDITSINSNPVTYTISGSSIESTSATITTEFGYDRQVYRPESYGTNEHGSVDDFEWAQHGIFPFVEVVWLPNENRYHEEGFHKVFTSYKSVSETGSVDVLPSTNYGTGTNVLTNNQCTYSYVATQTQFTSHETIIVIHFAVQSYGQTVRDIPLSIQSSSTLSEVRVLFGQRYILFGSALFMKTQTNEMTLQNVGDITDILTEKFCAEIVEHFCCDSGTQGVNSDGEPICTCAAGFFGDCCDMTCQQGNIITLQPNGGEICDCALGWGEEQCRIESHAAHFVSKMKYKKECQAKVADHYDYLYLHLDSGLHIAEVDNVADKFVTEIDYTIGTRSTSAIFGQFGSNPVTPYETVGSVYTNDFLFAMELPERTTHVGTWTVWILHEGIDASLTESEMSGHFISGTCGIWYHVLQRYNAANSDSSATADVFFVVGQAGYSKFPTSLSLVADLVPTTTDDYKSKCTVTGELSGLILGYTLIVTDAGGQIAEAELLDLVTCYADYACDSLPKAFECQNGVVTLEGNIPSCTCNEGWVGPACKYPAC
uniref:uncharacterized protein LOC120327291 n=1 Tax=Styela clava TaxID=7725 RepID=UPI001939FAA7|nr:uncharacterized protein LOC120327291 [Styela clava]